MLMMVEWMIGVIILVISLLIFVKFNKHMLLVLMSLEFFVVSMFYIWFLYFNMVDMNLYISVYYLIFSVNESVLGLTIMILIMRSEGGDYINSFNLLKC
uniref:NADH-ubiquinone oxidoreductase chain 4L n=1 Tax=Stenocephus fraxini TaxID=2963023 RepID=A0A9E8YZP4_9HYME|nr:NADH dehydrogenase subunit 4L [Stenocephus fraxini]WAK85077.1 NADH dehydrogenase subunit 4L [Stenocephus fraxini]